MFTVISSGVCIAMFSAARMLQAYLWPPLYRLRSHRALIIFTNMMILLSLVCFEMTVKRSTGWFWLP